MPHPLKSIFLSLIRMHCNSVLEQSKRFCVALFFPLCLLVQNRVAAVFYQPQGAHILFCCCCCCCCYFVADLFTSHVMCFLTQWTRWSERTQAWKTGLVGGWCLRANILQHILQQLYFRLFERCNLSVAMEFWGGLMQSLEIVSFSVAVLHSWCRVTRFKSILCSLIKQNS